VKQKVAVENMLEAYTQLPSIGSKEAVKLLKLQLKQTCQHIKKAEDAIDHLIKQTDLATNYQLLCSIKGVGRILAAQIIVHTNNFESFNNWRQFACYAGLAPFQYQSGSSIKGRTKVHPIADKKLKRLFNMAALSSIQHDPELKLYFQRKVEQGKNKMCVLNAVRCKILARAFSVVKRQTPYVPLCQFAA
jgi:transposase